MSKNTPKYVNVVAQVKQSRRNLTEVAIMQNIVRIPILNGENTFWKTFDELGKDITSKIGDEWVYQSITIFDDNMKHISHTKF